eukprot:TRINITY_DN9578_c0_g1_i4.p3 TRINITY_DN9578_c0_g1~~TRINITY_DN9578_c0_g1_i4.p3  ORF type:complete len:116 (-),score=1.41 TRINITY_DN9578_c0_g1_i4:164-511(-)
MLKDRRTVSADCAIRLGLGRCSVGRCIQKQLFILIEIEASVAKLIIDRTQYFRVICALPQACFKEFNRPLVVVCFQQAFALNRQLQARCFHDGEYKACSTVMTPGRFKVELNGNS